MAYRAEGLAALGDPTRREIFERLADRPHAVGELARQLPVSRPAVSQHLKVLKEAGLVFERREGGHVYDRGVDGSECRWARVLAYERPNRVVISWDISAQWQIEMNLEKTSEVEVRFVSEAPDRTRVELEHRNLERHGEG